MKTEPKTLTPEEVREHLRTGTLLYEEDSVVWSAGGCHNCCSVATYLSLWIHGPAAGSA
jgi:hypothetical protein